MAENETVHRIFKLVARKFPEQKAFAAALGTTPSIVSQWRNGVSKSYERRLSDIATILGTTVEYLQTGIELSSPLTVPVLGNVAAGIPIEAVQDIVDYEELDRAMAGTGEYFGLRLKGDSMEPRMRDGDVVIVRRQSDAETGDIVVAMVNGDSATVKKLKKGPSGITLIPNNPAFDPMFYSNEEIVQLPVRILGRVVELRAKF